MSSRTWASSCLDHFLFLFLYSTSSIEECAGGSLLRYQVKARWLCPEYTDSDFRILKCLCSCCLSQTVNFAFTDIWAKVLLQKKLPNKTSIEYLSCVPVASPFFNLGFLTEVSTTLNNIRSSFYEYLLGLLKHWWIVCYYTIKLTIYWVS